MVEKKSSTQEVRQATLATAADLRNIATNIAEERISELSLPEVDAVVDIVAKMVPAGNVPGLIASGLARLGSNNPSQTEVKRDIGMLFRGMSHMFDHAVYNVFFAGPAQVIHGYQNILKLTGKSPEAAFPEGTWQFYVDYALREDRARYAIETHGFDTALQDNNIHLDDIDRMTALVMTAIQTLHHYPRLLENEWRERVYIREIINLFDEEDEKRARYQKLFKQWLTVLPYRRMADARGDEDYPAYRRRKFDEWLFASLASLSKEEKLAWMQRVKAVKTPEKNQEKTEVEKYIEQMSIHSFLLPDQYAETRTPLDLQNIHVAMVYGDHYYLIPVCEKDSTDAIDSSVVRSYITAIVNQPSQHSPVDLALFADIKRGQWEAMRRKLPKKLVEELSMLRLCPIVLNFNPRNHEQAIAEIRQAERGIGDHALTIFDTRKTFVFDQSHIYFDGAWGAALAEIMTNEALAQASRLANQERIAPTERPYSPRFELSKSMRQYVERLERVTPEVAAESTGIRLDRVLALRRIFKRRSDLLRLTVNDLLLLYRAIHAVTYQAHPELISDLSTLMGDKFTRDAALKALEAIKAHSIPPAILMPVDASQNSPRDRLYPMSFEVPLAELNLLQLHRRVMDALDNYEKGGDGKIFDETQRQYLASLAGFGTVMRRAKEIANAGLSGSVGTIKLLAHIPFPLQKLMNQIPQNFDVLNDLIKGREVFSNIGQVAKSSTLTRFITAKDDNDKKELAWGVLTDARGKTFISLRDFRPHVQALIAIGHKDIAEAITRDYLDAYVSGFNTYIHDLQRITMKSRETRMMK